MSKMLGYCEQVDLDKPAKSELKFSFLHSCRYSSLPFFKINMRVICDRFIKKDSQSPYISEQAVHPVVNIAQRVQALIPPH